MSQLARRENAPHRAAFVTSLSRWYICRLLGNLPPFHPCLSAESEAPFCPLRNIVTLRAYSSEIKVRQAISVFLSVYPELVALIGSRVPDYRGLFLRGVGGNSAALGILQEDEIKSHSHKIPRRMILPGEGLKHDSSLEEAGLEPYAVSGESSYTGGNETRPKNRAVRYLIRVR